MSVLFNALVVILMVSGVIGFVVQQIFLSRLRKIHTGTQDQSGKPIIFVNRGKLNPIEYLRFIWRREYESLDNTKVVGLGRFLRGFLIFYFSLFGFMGVIFILMFILPK